MDQLTAAALAASDDNLAAGNEVFERAGARFVRNTSYASIRDANHVDSVTARTPRDIRALLEAAEEEYAHADVLRFDLDARTPPEFEAALLLAGYKVAGRAMVLILEGEIARRIGGVDIRLVTSDEDWRAFEAVHAIAWGAAAFTPDIESAMVGTMRLKSPPMRYWMAYVDGQPVGGLNSWEGTSGIGQLETMFVHPEFRHRGIATALLGHCVDDARAQGAGPIVIVASADDTPKQMYADLGWRPVAVKREYHRAR